MASPRMALYDQAHGDDASIVAHLGLVKRVALHLQARVPRYVDMDDLVQAGMIGLVEAARAFDASKGISFEGFAYIRIRGAMFDEVRRLSYLTRSAVAVKKNHAEFEHELTNKLGRQPTERELAEFMGKDLELLQQERAEGIRFETTSIETLPIPVENIPDLDTARPDVQVENAQFMEALVAAIEELPEREKLVISLYYVEEMTLREIGEVIGVSESRVSQMLSATAKNLRGILKV